MTNPSPGARERKYKNLERTARRVLRGLNARIEQAPLNAVPVFDGIAELHDALNALASGDAP